MTFRTGLLLDLAGNHLVEAFMADSCRADYGRDEIVRDYQVLSWGHLCKPSKRDE